MMNEFNVRGKKINVEGKIYYAMCLNLFDAMEVKAYTLDLDDINEVPEVYRTTFILMLQSICNSTKCEIFFREDGRTIIYSRDRKRFNKAAELLEARIEFYFGEFVA